MSLKSRLPPDAWREANLIGLLVDGAVIADSTGNVVYMNAAALELHGFSSPEEAAKKGVEYSYQFSLRTLEDHPVPFEEWPISRIARRERFSNLRYRVRRNDGVIDRFLSYSGTPVEIAGQYAYALLSIRDVTDEVRATRQNLESERRLRAALAHLPHAVMIFGPNLRLQYINELGLQFPGLAKNPLGLLMEEFAPEEVVVTFGPLLKAALATKQVQRGVFTLSGLSRKEMEITYVPLLNSVGDVQQILGVFRDRTEESRHIRELKSFAYAVSHDLQAPVRAVTSYTDIVLAEFSDALAEEPRHMLERVKAAGLHMSQLIDDLLRLSGISVTDVHLEEVDLVKVSHSIVDHIVPEWGGTLIAPVRILARSDRGLLSLVLGNLIRNAIKFSAGKASPVVEVGVNKEKSVPAYFVRDNGVGFEPTDAGKLFHPFFRAHDDRAIPGTGIGLAIVERAIERMGGRVWAESTPGAGACFYFTLPFSTDSDVPACQMKTAKGAEE